MRRPSVIAPPKRTAATSPMTASVSIALTGGLVLKPPSSDAALSPAHSATAAAKSDAAARRHSAHRARAITSRWISFVPS